MSALHIQHDYKTTSHATPPHLTIDIDPAYHGFQFGLGRTESQRAHHRSQLLCGDRAIAVLVEHTEGIAKL